MKKTITILVLTLVCALALALAGCVEKGTMGSDIDDAGTYTVTADKAGKGSAVGTDGGIVVKDGQVLVVSPNLDKGSLQVKLVSSDSPSAEAVVDEEVSGKELDTHKIAPGEYGIMVTCTAEGTTGSLVVAAVDEAEFEKQNRDLEAILGNVEG